MAIQTKVQGTLYEDATHVARLEYDYDDIALVITTARCVNGTSVPVFVTIARISDGFQYGPFTVAPGATLAQNVPASGAGKIDITVDARGRLVGIRVVNFGM